MDHDPLRDATRELRDTVAGLGGQQLLAAIHEAVSSNEEATVSVYDERWDDLWVEEILEWQLVGLRRTGPGTARAEIDVVLIAFPVEEEEAEDDDDPASSATQWILVRAYLRLSIGSEARVASYEIDLYQPGQFVGRGDAPTDEEPPSGRPPRQRRDP